MNLIDFILRRIMGRMVNRGIGLGIDRMVGGGKSRDQMTPEERKSAREARQTARRARRATRLARRMMR